ncbi:MAG TPA: hypothetical protein VNO31_09680 [Umezawaea sp.]|nr:hypothetical protein [Umezawaea sp.]
MRALAVAFEFSGQGAERLGAAAVILAEGDVHEFRSAVRLANLDWRDLLVAGGLAHENWPDVLDEVLGPR